MNIRFCFRLITFWLIEEMKRPFLSNVMRCLQILQSKSSWLSYNDTVAVGVAAGVVGESSVIDFISL